MFLKCSLAPVLITLFKIFFWFFIVYKILHKPCLIITLLLQSNNNLFITSHTFLSLYLHYVFTPGLSSSSISSNLSGLQWFAPPLTSFVGNNQETALHYDSWITSLALCMLGWQNTELMTVSRPMKPHRNEAQETR